MKINMEIIDETVKHIKDHKHENLVGSYFQFFNFFTFHNIEIKYCNINSVIWPVLRDDHSVYTEYKRNEG